MFLTKECDYAIRIVRGLSDSTMKSVQTICDLENIPRPFAYKILKKLENAGIVSSRRGALGGYIINKPLKELTLFEITNAVSDQLFINDCLQKGHVCPRNSNGVFCGVHVEFSRIQELLINALGEKTIHDLV